MVEDFVKMFGFITLESNIVPLQILLLCKSEYRLTVIIDKHIVIARLIKLCVF